MNEDELRAIGFARWVVDRTSTDVVPSRWGRAYLDLEFPRRYDSNFLWVDGAPADVTADGLVEEADRILGSRGMRHRSVLVDDPELARRLGMRFGELGWAVDALALMVLRGEPDRPRDRSLAAELPFAELRALQEEHTRRSQWATDEEIVRMLADHREKLARTIGARFFGARVDGELAAMCELYVHGDAAQIESVETLEEFRNRGAASAVVLAAVEAARGSGATWIHLYADANDWPQRWYRRLGFVDRGGFWNFNRYPENQARSSAAPA
ncbi:MAG: GNAT family N-acetyltransferase [Planctomycetaceae bacterium]